MNCFMRVNQKDEKGSCLLPGYCSNALENALISYSVTVL